MLKPTKKWRINLTYIYFTFQIANNKGDGQTAEAQASLRLCCSQAIKPGFFTSWPMFPAPPPPPASVLNGGGYFCGLLNYQILFGGA